MHPSTPIYLLKICSEDTPGKNKNRNIHIGKSTVEELELCRLSIVGPLEDIWVYIRVIKVLVLKLPLPLVEHYTTGYFMSPIKIM